MVCFVHLGLLVWRFNTLRMFHPDHASRQKRTLFLEFPWPLNIRIVRYLLPVMMCDFCLKS